MSNKIAYQNKQGNIVIPAPINGGTVWGAFEILPSGMFQLLEDKKLPLRSWGHEVAQDLARYAKKEGWPKVDNPHLQKG